MKRKWVKKQMNKNKEVDECCHWGGASNRNSICKQFIAISSSTLHTTQHITARDDSIACGLFILFSHLLAVGVHFFHRDIIIILLHIAIFPSFIYIIHVCTCRCLFMPAPVCVNEYIFVDI